MSDNIKLFREPWVKWFWGEIYVLKVAGLITSALYFVL